MELQISIFIIYEDEDGVRIWSGRKDDYLTPLEWSDLVKRVGVQKFALERSGENVHKGRGGEGTKTS